MAETHDKNPRQKNTKKSSRVPQFYTAMPKNRSGPKKTLASKAYGTDNIGPLKFS